MKQEGEERGEGEGVEGGRGQAGEGECSKQGMRRGCKARRGGRKDTVKWEHHDVFSNMQ